MQALNCAQRKSEYLTGENPNLNVELESWLHEPSFANTDMLRHIYNMNSKGGRSQGTARLIAMS